VTVLKKTVMVLALLMIAIRPLPAGQSLHVYSNEELISAYIYLLSKNTRWPVSLSNKPFRIGILERGGNIRKTFWKLTKDLHLHGRKIWVTGFSRPEKIDYDHLDVLFVDSRFSGYIARIYRSIPPHTPLLLISRDADDTDHIMINIYHDSRDRNRIQINRKNIESHGLRIGKKILLAGGEEVGISKLFNTSLEALKAQERRYEKLKATSRKFEEQIAVLKKDIALFRDELAYKRKIVEQKEKELRNTVRRLSRQQAMLREKEKKIKEKAKKLKLLEEEYNRLKAETNEQKKRLQARLKEIERQEKEISRRAAILATQQEHIIELDREISRQKQKIDEQKEVISAHEQALKRQSLQLKEQTVTMYALTGIVMALILFAWYFYHNKRLLESLTKKLREAKENAEYANRSKSIFLTNMSHELRTPLNAIMGFSDLLLKDESLSPVQRERLGIIFRSGSFLLGLINDVLNLARVESGKIQIEKAPMDLGALIEETMALMSQRAKNKGLEIVLDQTSRFPRCIVADGEKIRQILLNYLSNAIKYSHKGTIRLSLDADGSFLYMHVADEGVGIEKEDLERVFEPFIQVGEASEKTGSGLGLSITKEFVEAMGGRVWAESKPGEGSTFHAAIPYQVCENGENNILKSQKRSEVIGLDPSQKGIKVLIAEDKEDNRMLLRSILDVLGVEVKEALNGEEAVEIFKTWHPDFIWMDRRMPKMNGEEATRIIRSLPGGDKVVIVALTASAFADEKKKVMAAGMDGFVVKPYVADEIYETMKEFLGLRYIYKNNGDDDENAQRQLPVDKDSYADALMALDDETLDKLFEAAVLLDEDALEELLGTMPDSPAAAMTARLAEHLEFRKILETIQEVKARKKR